MTVHVTPLMHTSSRLHIATDLNGVVKFSIAAGANWSDALAQLVGSAGAVYPHATGDADVVAADVNKAAIH